MSHVNESPRNREIARWVIQKQCPKRKIETSQSNENSRNREIRKWVIQKPNPRRKNETPQSNESSRNREIQELNEKEKRDLPIKWKFPESRNPRNDFQK